MLHFELGYQPVRIQISPTGIVPKKIKPGKWRIITDLSSPEGSSVNNAISIEHSSLKYLLIYRPLVFAGIRVN